MQTLWQDLRYGARMLMKQPGFTLIALVTLALGIGANVALFSIVKGVLLNPLPFPQPDQIVTLHQSKPNFPTGAIPYPNFRDWQKENQTFAAMAISRRSSFNLLGAGEPEQLNGRWVSAEFFSVLGVQPALGSNFKPGEDERGAPPVVLISASFWQRKFSASAGVLRQTLTLDDKSYTIVGVLPASFTLYPGIEIYVPIGQWNTPALQNRQAALGLHGIGRLKPGVTPAQAQADLDRVMRRLAEVYPDANRGHGAALIPLKEQLVGDVRLKLWLLLGAVGFVLLIACVNVSNLLLARATGRTSEFAIRAALGAGRSRLVRQAMVENTLLAVSGGAFGLLAAAWGTQVALSVLPATLPRTAEIRLDAGVLMFTFVVALLTGVLAGLIPAWKAVPQRLAETIKEGGRGTSIRCGRAQRLLVGLEMALALVLLVGAGLMIRSLSALWQVDPGFRAENVLTFSIGFAPSLQAASPEAARLALRELSDKLNTMPGARGASFSTGAAPLQQEDDTYFWLDGQPKPASTGEMKMAVVYRVEPAYLTALGIPLKQGRFFSEQDTGQTPNVAVIDEAFAREYFLREDPVGKRINLVGGREPFEIVGVAGHVKQWSLDTDERQSLQAQLYLPFRQMGGSPRGVGVVMRLAGNQLGANTFDAVRRVVQSQHSQNVVFGTQTMQEVIASSLAARRFSMLLLGAFAAVALLLASIGLYGVISYLTRQRTRELGIRLALGARRVEILRLVLRDGLKLALGGVAGGVVAALGLTRLLAGMVYGVSTTDPLTFLVIALSLTAVAFLACLIPALRATQVDPMTALRME